MAHLHRSGDEIGSTFIDREFRKLVEKRLEDVKDLVNTDVSDLKSIALHMSNDPTFQAHKYEVGNRRSGGDNTVRVRIPNMKRPITDHDLLIQRGIMVFDRSVIDCMVANISPYLHSTALRLRIYLRNNFMQ